MKTLPVFVQIGAHSILDEGPEACLDGLAQRAINGLTVFTHNYGGLPRQAHHLAPDHGLPPERRRHPQGQCWYTPDPAIYRQHGTDLAHRRHPDREGYPDADLARDILPAARARGMQVHARILAWHNRAFAQWIPGFERLLGTDLDGGAWWHACWNHPEYRAWWEATATDLFTQVPLDGLKLGAEIHSPLSAAAVWEQPGVGCFCPRCCAAAAAQGVDPERAKAGYRALRDWRRRMATAVAAPDDGALVQFLRLLWQWPEILGWDRLWHRSITATWAAVRAAARRVRPQAQVGAHIFQYHVHLDPLARATEDLAELAGLVDYIKPSIYPEAAGDRAEGMVLRHLQPGLFRDLPPREALSLFYRCTGLDPAAEPTLDGLGLGALSPAHAANEVRRCKAAAAGRCAVYAGLGMDLPLGGPRKHLARTSDPDLLAAHARACLAAGADGFVLSREYDEIRLTSLDAIAAVIRNG
jgi:hypothetical protein